LIWTLNLGSVDVGKRNEVLIYGIGGVNIVLAYLVLVKERRGRRYLLAAFWVPLIGIVVGSLIV
jgi:hypothetical protein